MKVTGSTVQQLERDKPRSRCRKWRLWATTDHGRKSRRFAGTYTQALDALKAFVAELEAQVPNAESFAAYAESWRLWRVESGAVARGTSVNEKSHVAKLSASPIGDMRMDALTAEACRDALVWCKSEHSLSGATLANVHRILAMIVAQAHAEGKLASDVMASVKPPKVDTPEKRALDSGELLALLDALDALPPDGRVMAVYFMACLGLRRGEALALADADVGDGLCRVLGSYNAELSAPKTRAGVRTLPVPPRLQAKVDGWRDVRDALGWQGAPMCCNSLGARMSPQSLNKWWTAHRDALGCEGLVLHQLRHSNLTLVARHMSAFDLQRYAGWSSLAPTRIYIHDDFDAVVRGVQSAWDSIERTRNAPI